MTGKITKGEAQELRQFFAMERWTELVDLVFVLTCDPKVSIEREYADQLTTKRGTIMAEETLNQFLEATNRTLLENSAKFKKILRFDTTNTKTQYGVANIADEALKVLNAFLDESICVVPLEALKTGLPDSGFVSDATMISGFLDTVHNSKAFTPRSDAEQNPNYLQPIPCAVLRYDDKILILRRKKPGHPLHDKYDVWAGGHVNQADDGDDILLNTLHRELEEEVFIKEAFELNPKPIGLIRTNEDARASRHVAILYELTLKNENVALAMNQKEFRSTRGSSMSGRLVSVKEIGSLYENMGNWSKFIVGHFWPDQLPKSGDEAQLFES
jgi:predicted NUDIX family phosphoesterase